MKSNFKILGLATGFLLFSFAGIAQEKISDVNGAGKPILTTASSTISTPTSLKDGELDANGANNKGILEPAKAAITQSDKKLNLKVGETDANGVKTLPVINNTNGNSSVALKAEPKHTYQPSRGTRAHVSPNNNGQTKVYKPSRGNAQYVSPNNNGQVKEYKPSRSK